MSKTIIKEIMLKKILHPSLAVSLVISLTLILSGCSVYKNKFDCPAKKGIGCESVSKVNELINDDELESFTEDLEAKSNKKSRPGNYRSKTKKSCNCNRSKINDASNFSNYGDEDKPVEKFTIHFNQYKEKGIHYKESEVEVNLDGK